ncbi:shikimate dehydrogenase [Aureibacillus halotolerans]|uniref:Shikimate dehydrogenase (NADP(+)) n=1 Tax=Aureibacillus halotolerans TaxID=1508390 RepID=A0A4R6TW21_9BACI|nr:shikimate dehydrogenase [Aureibacillus halotolerans]TDQ38030.1 shikimate dehydrogenase [Aureibacillus halotolerans]
MDLYGLIGHPIGHSLSPIMHNEAFASLGIDASYIAYSVDPTELPEAVRGLKALGVKGFNVTIPHKVAIMPLLDSIDPLALKLGAVNTVVIDQGKLIGYNTDGLGYLRSLNQILPKPLEDSNVLIVGAGGAARALFITLDEKKPQKLDIVNRSFDRAETLIKGSAHPENHTIFTYEEAEVVLQTYDVIINTTSVGMSPNDSEQPLSLNTVTAGSVVSDIVYNPLETALLKEAKAKGCIVHDGVGMFVGQGALAFEHWTKQQAPEKRMRQVVLEALAR